MLHPPKSSRHTKNLIVSSCTVQTIVVVFVWLVVVGYVLCGDGLEDQVSPDLLKACSSLMKEKADSFDEVRQILLEKLEKVTLPFAAG